MPRDTPVGCLQGHSRTIHITTPTFACTKCGLAQPRASFYNSIHGPDGRAYHCRTCVGIARKRYYEENSEKVQRRNKAYNASNIPAYLWRIAKRRADRKGVPFSITPADVIVPTHCPVLGTRLERGSAKGETDTSPTIDRLVPALGYAPGNIRVISGRANRIKSNATVAEVRALLAWMEAEGIST
jgi:hypothetical protein